MKLQKRLPRGYEGHLSDDVSTWHAEKNLKLAVLKRSWSDADNEHLDEAIRTEFRRAHEENQKAAQKVSRLPPGPWKNDRMEQLRRWQTIPSVNYATFSLGDDIKVALDTFFDGMVQFSINDNSETPVSSKPPVLHWTPLPLDSELQVLIRISFPLAGPDNSTFVDIRKSLREHANSIYEWTEGILLNDDPVHLHLERVSPTQIELAARVCVDELEEEQAAQPSKLLWPYVALGLKNTLSHLSEHEYLQYSLELIPYGASFYDSPVQARVFDLPQFMGTASEYEKVAFRYKEKVYNVHLDELCPNGPFTSLSHLLEVVPPRPKRPQLNSFAEDVFGQSNGEANCKPPPTTGLHVAQNRGRRVSFGSIKLMTESNSTAKGVDDYVDAMLKQTMDHLVL
ncbi:hypothetical protein ANCCEY_13487 [Ancylostoma ceylanicum]|uniref:Uncharacterized protein n=1 Tax=Ancylostoma ceylanicum TaxID=53326 RepID=A0A0D6LC64_9BILA|nr:hypothetical protein ANCCEY_13487 [Ancylostoma ceylanicum]